MDVKSSNKAGSGINTGGANSLSTQTGGAN